MPLGFAKQLRAAIWACVTIFNIIPCRSPNWLTGFMLGLSVLALVAGSQVGTAQDLQIGVTAAVNPEANG